MRTSSPGQSASPPELRAGDTMLADLERARRREKRILRWSVALAFLAHGVLLSITLPSLGTTPQEFQRDTTVYVLQQPRFNISQIRRRGHVPYLPTPPPFACMAQDQARPVRR